MVKAMKSGVPFFDYKATFSRYESLGDELLRVFQSGQYILGPDLAVFEKAVLDKLGYKNFLGVADGTNAIQLGLNCMGVGHGDKVFVSSHTYVATASALVAVGAEPVLVDVDLTDGSICSSSIMERYDGTQTGVIITQLNGRCCDMNKLIAVCDQLGLRLFEDSAQAFGAKYGGKLAGTFGEFGTFSFYPAKTLGCFGDGGGIVLRDDANYDLVRATRDHGRDGNGDVRYWGFNSRLDNVQAALLTLKLKYYIEDLERRRAIAKRYVNSFQGLEGIVCPPFDGDGRYDIFQNFELRAKNRDQLLAHLSNNNIGARIQWGGTPLHEMKELGLSESRELFPNCTTYFNECLMLPLYPALSDAQIESVIYNVRHFYGAL